MSIAAAIIGVTQENATIIVAFLALVGTVFSAVWAYHAKNSARSVDNAVNHRAPGEARLVEMVAEALGRVREMDRAHVRLENQIIQTGRDIADDVKAISDRLDQHLTNHSEGTK